MPPFPQTNFGEISMSASGRKLTSPRLWLGARVTALFRPGGRLAMKVSACVAVALVSSATCLVVIAQGASRSGGYVYDSAEPGNTMAIVIDVTHRYVEVQDKSDVHVGSMLTDLGGSYKDCGNEAFLCLTGALELVVPKSLGASEWRYNGLSCRSVSEPQSDAFRITCQSPGYAGRHAFTYSPTRGVLSIDSSLVGGSGRSYKLRGRYGLFSPGSSF